MKQNHEIITDYTYVEGTSVQQRNSVLRNTYWLLSLTMVPTVIGAYIGMKSGFMLTLAQMGPIMGTLVMLAVMIGLIFAVHKTKNSPLGVAFLLGFTFVMGLFLSATLSFYLARYSNGGQLIMLAFGGTAGIFFTMASVATVIKRDLSAMGKWLFIGLIMLIVAMFANFFLQSSALSIAISSIAIGIFSAYILYDIKRVIDGGETNYITATLSIYLDLINLFVHLLRILAALFGED